MADGVRVGRERRRQAHRKRWRSSIRTQVLAIVLIPSAALFITGAVVAGYLISSGLSARNFASYFSQASGAIVQSSSTLKQERTLSLLAVGGDRQALAALPAQWNATNAAVTRIGNVGAAGHGLDPQAVGAAQQSSAATGAQFTSQLVLIRQNVQARRATVSEVDSFYTRFINLASTVQLPVAFAAPAAAAAADGVTALGLFSIPELHSRAVGLAAGWAERGVPTQPDRLELAQLTGAYQNDLQTLVPQLPTPEQAVYQHMSSGSAWELATSGENDLALNGKLAVPLASWLTAENTVSADLLGLWGDDLRYAQSVAVTEANQTLSRSILLGSLVLVLAAGAFAAALVLANGLVRRPRPRPILRRPPAHLGQAGTDTAA